MKALIIVLFIPLALLESMAIYDSVFPFSDEEISASMVDTWQPAAIITDLALIFIALVALVALVLLIASRQLRVLATSLLIACVACATHLAINQNQLDQRTHKFWGTGANPVDEPVD